ncbi:Cell cycle serine/threonine-protein kinase cdc5/MSD2 [Conglomerata obtusa]
MPEITNPFFGTNHIIHDTTNNRHYTIKDNLGSGAFAQCFLVTSDHGETLALKVVDHEKIKSKNIMSKLETEIEIHRQMDHPHVVKMYSYFRTNEYTFLVLEYCENKGLDEYLKAKKKEYIQKMEKNDNDEKTKKAHVYGTENKSCNYFPVLSEDEVRKFMMQLNSALQYLHEEKRVIHRDLKLGNLFLDQNYNIKVGDFGLSSTISGNQKKKTVCGTPNYIAPEVLFDKEIGHSFEVDIWSYGIILYTLLVGTPPFQKRKVNEIYETIKKMDYTFPREYNYGRYSRELIKSILNRNPVERPSLKEIMEHRFFVKKENTIERMIRNITDDLFVEVNLSINNTQKIDFATFILPLSRFKGIGYTLASGSKGVYYSDYTNIVINDNVISYLYRSTDNSGQIIRKEDFGINDNLPPLVKEKYEQLQFFVKNFCRSFEKLSVTGTHAIRVKKIKDTILMGLYNGVVEFEVLDCKRIVIADEGKIIYCFDHVGKKVKFTKAMKDHCLNILKLIK